MDDEARSRPAERRRVEIVHESLLTNWPRLVGWQTQDADGARVRDELRQAARLWEEHDRSENRLWVGTTFHEYQLWRARYSGGLTELEEEFAAAATALALRRRRRRRTAVTTVIALLSAVLAYVTVLRQQAIAEKRRAEQEARSAQASKLLALGAVELEVDPGAALAYALASLELADGETGRLFALRALFKGPPSFVAEDSTSNIFSEFSPRGSVLAAGGHWGLAIHPRGGSPARLLQESKNFSPNPGWEVAFGSQDDLLAVRSARDPALVGVWSLADDRQLGSFRAEGPTVIASRRDPLLLTFTIPERWGEGIVRRWRLDAAHPERIGSWRIEDLGSWDQIDLDHGEERLVYARGRRVYSRPLRDPSAGGGEALLIGEHEARVLVIRADPWRPRVASGDAQGVVRVWSLAPDAREPVRLFRGRGTASKILFDPAGAWLAVDYREPAQAWHLWPLEGPEGASPLVLASRSPAEAGWTDGAAFTPDGRWFAANLGDLGKTLHFFPLEHRYPTLVRSAGSGVRALTFTADGRTLLSSHFRSALESLDLATGRRRELWKSPGGRLGALALAVSPGSQTVLVGSAYEGARLVSLADGSERPLPNDCLEECWTRPVGLSPDGRQAAWSVAHGKRVEDRGIRLFDLESGRLEILAASRGEAHYLLRYASDGALQSLRCEDESCVGPCHDFTVLRWDLQSSQRREVARLHSVLDLAASENAQFLLAAESSSGECADAASAPGRAVARLFDLDRGTSRVLESHGDRIYTAAIDSRQRLLVTGSSDGAIRVGPLSGETPHLLLGHEREVAHLAIDPAGRWIASGDSTESVIRLWPMPDLSKPPLHTLPYDQLLSKLRSLTNLRVVADASSPTGYKLDVGPFPGWETVPEW